MRDDSGAQAGQPAQDTGGLPIAGYDHMTVPMIEERARSLTSEELEELVAYETAHQGRTQVIRLLTAQLRRLREAAAEAQRRPGGYGPPPQRTRPGAG